MSLYVGPQYGWASARLHGSSLSQCGTPTIVSTATRIGVLLRTAYADVRWHRCGGLLRRPESCAGRSLSECCDDGMRAVVFPDQRETGAASFGWQRGRWNCDRLSLGNGIDFYWPLISRE